MHREFVCFQVFVMGWRFGVKCFSFCFPPNAKRIVSKSSRYRPSSFVQTKELSTKSTSNHVMSKIVQMLFVEALSAFSHMEIVASILIHAGEQPSHIYFHPSVCFFGVANLSMKGTNVTRRPTFFYLRTRQPAAA